ACRWQMRPVRCWLRTFPAPSILPLTTRHWWTATRCGPRKPRRAKAWFAWLGGKPRGQGPRRSRAPRPRPAALEAGATRAGPAGADAVVMVERTEMDPDASDIVRVKDASLRAGQNIMRRGEAMRCGETVLNRGQRLRAIEVGLLAELGLTQINVFALPTVAVL